MRIDLKALSQSEQKEIRFDYSTQFHDTEVHHAFPFTAPVFVSGRVYEQHGARLLEGLVETTVKARCARCLKDFSYPKRLDFSFLLTNDPDAEESDELLIVSGQSVDLDEIARTELILSMDMAELCDEGCKGICPVCGQNRNEHDCACGQTE